MKRPLLGLRVRQLAGRIGAISGVAGPPPPPAVAIFTGAFTPNGSDWVVTGGATLIQSGNKLYVSDATQVATITAGLCAGAANFSNSGFLTALTSISFSGSGGLTGCDIPVGLAANLTLCDLFNNALPIGTSTGTGVYGILNAFDGVIATINLSGGTSATNGTVATQAASLQTAGCTVFINPDAPTGLANAQAYSSTVLGANGSGEAVAPNVGSYNFRASTDGGLTWHTVTNFCAFGSLSTGGTYSLPFTPNQAVRVELQSVNSGGGNAAGPWSVALDTHTGPAAPGSFTVINAAGSDTGTYTAPAGAALYNWDTATPPTANPNGTLEFSSPAASPGTTYYVAAQNSGNTWGDIATATSTADTLAVAAPSQVASVGLPLQFGGLLISGGVPPYGSATVDPGDGSGALPATVDSTPEVVFIYAYASSAGSPYTYVVSVQDSLGATATNSGAVTVS